MPLSLKINSKKSKNNSDKEWLDRHERKITYASYVFVAAYVYGMIFYPWGKSLSWSHVHEVWMSWQSLNVGVLAFISTFFIYKATKHSENVKRNRNFKAEKAFLPNALIELTRYLEENSRYLENCLNTITSDPQSWKPTISASLPSLPIKHEEVFRRCILTAGDDVADYLSGILMRLQIFAARMKEVDDYFNGQGKFFQNKDTIKLRTYDLVEIDILTTNLFDFARNKNEFRNRKINREDIENSILNLELAVGKESEMIVLVEEYLNGGGIMK